MWTYSPSTPALDAFEPAVAQNDPVIPAPPSLSPRVSDEPGNPLDAPLVNPARTYAPSTPCANRAAPYDLRRRPPPGYPRSVAGSSADEDAEEYEPLPDRNLDPEGYKRRKNTYAARKSRQRKADYVRGLEEQTETLWAEATLWRGRALLALKLLQSRDIMTEFSFDDEPEEQQYCLGHL